MAAELFALTLAVAIPVVLLYLYPSAVRSAYMSVATAKDIVGAVLGLITGAIFLTTGIWYLMLIGALIFGFAVLAVIFERPDQVILAWIPV